MSDQEVKLALTAGQVAQVLQAAGDDTGASSPPMLGWMDPVALVRSSLLIDDRRLSKSVLIGLAVLVSYPADGSSRRLKDVAHELGLALATTHRYVHTLAVIGLLEQDPATRCYRRAGGDGG